MGWTVRALAERLGLQHEGESEREIVRVASLESAGPDCLSFLYRAHLLDQLAHTNAGVVIVAPGHVGRVRGAALIADNPYAAYARAAQLLHPLPSPAVGVDRSAHVHESARVDDGAHIGPHAVIEAGASIGEGAVVGAGAYVGAGVVLGERSRLGPRCVVGDGCRIGRRCLFQPGVVIGSDGFGYARDGDAWIRIPQVGRVVIGDDVQIGANTTIDRGALDDTVIGDGVILDNQIQIAHNVRIGDHTAMAGCVGVAGSAVIGRRCTIGGAAAVLGHLEITDDVHVTAMSLVTRSIDAPGTYSSGVPLEPTAEWRRNAVRFRQLDSIARRLGALEKKVAPDDDPGGEQH